MPDTEPSITPQGAPSPDTSSQAGEPVPDDVAWQRMSPRFIVVGTVRQLRGLVIPAALILFTGNMGRGNSELIYIGIALAITAFAALTSTVEWWNFRYALTDREFISRSGIVQKQERAVPYGRIQAINLDEAPLERLVGIVRVKIETAAGGATDIDVRAIERDAAPRLRESLAAARAHARQGDGATDAAQAETQRHAEPADASAIDSGEVIRRLSTPELLALGATSGRIGPMAAVVGALIQFSTELMPQSWWNRVPWQQAEVLRNVGVAVTLLLVIAVITWLLAIASTALTFGGFELRRSGDQLLVQHGLLDRRRRTIPIQRVQAVIVGEPLLRQPFHRADIRFESAGGEVEGASGDSGVLFPFLPLHEVESLLRQAVPAFAADPAAPMTTRLPARALRRYVTAATSGWLVFVAAVAASLALWLDRWITFIGWQQVLLFLLATPAFIWLGWARWRDGGWRVDGDAMMLRWRAVSRQTLITRTGRIQRRELIAGPLQRRASLATVQVSVASGLVGGHYALPHADRDDAERVMAAIGGPRHNVVVRRVPAPAGT